MPLPVAPVTRTSPSERRDLLEDLRRLDLLECQDLGRDLTKDHPDAAGLGEDVDTKSREPLEADGEVDLKVFFVDGLLLGRHDRVGHAFRIIRRQGLKVETPDLTVDAHGGDLARREVDVGCAVLDREGEHLVDLDLHARVLPRLGPKRYSRRASVAQQAVDCPCEPDLVSGKVLLECTDQCCDGPGQHALPARALQRSRADGEPEVFPQPQVLPAARRIGGEDPPMVEDHAARVCESPVPGPGRHPWGCLGLVAPTGISQCTPQQAEIARLDAGGTCDPRKALRVRVVRDGQGPVAEHPTQVGCRNDGQTMQIDDGHALGIIRQ